MVMIRRNREERERVREVLMVEIDGVLRNCMFTEEVRHFQRWGGGRGLQ